jgi:tRNA C32,U32 (ribose-2'-O)-methylase TrmJ
MSKWRDFLEGVPRKEDLESLIEEAQHELKLLKPMSLSEEARLQAIRDVLSEAKLKAREINHINEVLNKKISILEENLDL